MKKDVFNVFKIKCISKKNQVEINSCYEYLLHVIY